VIGCFIKITISKKYNIGMGDLWGGMCIFFEIRREGETRAKKGYCHNLCFSYFCFKILKK
jgi:hypothetical protein